MYIVSIIYYVLADIRSHTIVEYIGALCITLLLYTTGGHSACTTYY